MDAPNANAFCQTSGLTLTQIHPLPRWDDACIYGGQGSFTRYTGTDGVTYYLFACTRCGVIFWYPRTVEPITPVS